MLPYPLDAGAKVRAYYVLRRLASAHQVTLVSFTRRSDTPASFSHLEGCCERLITVPIRRSFFQDGRSFVSSVLTGQPFLIVRDRVPEMKAVLEKLMVEESYEAVHADQLWMAAYALQAGAAARRSGKNVRLVLDQHNATYLIPERMAANTQNPLKRALLRREARLMGRYEAEAVAQFDFTVWVSQEDREAVSELGLQAAAALDRTRNAVIPICIDPDLVNFRAAQPASPDVLFIGGMHWPPAAEGVSWFADQVFPRLRSLLPSARFTAVGKSPPPGLDGSEGILAPGFVQDIEPYWESARVFVVPLLSAGGMRVKILEAWAHGIPVISTTIGAEGIIAKDGSDILIADTPEAFAQAVKQVLEDDQLASRLSQNGRKSVEIKYNWRTSYGQFDVAYRSS